MYKINDGELFTKENDPEFELAFALQNGKIDVTHLLDILLEKYAADVYQLAYAVLVPHARGVTLTREVNRIVVTTFRVAVNEASHFWGHDSIRTWLFSIVLQQIRNRSGWKSFLRHPDFDDETAWYTPELLHPQPKGSNSTMLDILPEPQRLVIILHYLYGLSVENITELVGSTNQKVENRLITARERIITLLTGGDGPKSRLFQSVYPLISKHAHIRRAIHALLDGLLYDALEKNEWLNKHLSACQSCQDYANRLINLDQDLKKTLTKRWPRPILDEVQLHALAKSIKMLRTAAHHEIPIKGFFKIINNMAWVVGLMLVISGSFWLLNRNELGNTLPRPQPEPTVTPLPAPIVPEMVSLKGPDQASTKDSYGLAFSEEPVISSNGRWVVFSSSNDSLVEGDTNKEPDIFVYDRKTLKTERVNIASNGTQADGWSSSPGISSDGRWIVFASNADNLVQNQLSPIPAGVHIYLRDRETNLIQRIDSAIGNDSTGNDNSYNPAISADGQIIAYWSTTKDIRSCGQKEISSPCLDIYLYDTSTHTTEQVMIGRPMYQLRWDSRLTLSANGDRMALTIYDVDFITNYLHFASASSVYVYDRQRHQFLTADLSDSEAPGNGASFAPNISADGHIVAFASNSTNLVEGDTNGKTDVFIRDIEDGNTERMSVTSEGKQSNGNSGPVLQDQSAWRDNIGLSSDGRYVAFLSEEQDLETTNSQTCAQVIPGGCSTLYVHDRTTGKTQRITAPVGDRTYIFSSLSADGRWMVYMDLQPDCYPLSKTLACSEMYLHDVQSGWNAPITSINTILMDNRWQAKIVISNQYGIVNRLAFSPNGRLLASGNDQNGITLWQVADNTPVMNIEIPERSGNVIDTVTSLAFSPDGKYIAGGMQYGSVLIWRVSDGIRLFTLSHHPGKVIYIAYSLDGGDLLVATPQAIWNWHLTGKDIYTRQVAWSYQAGTVRALALSPSGNFAAIAASDNTVWMLNIHTGKIVLRLGNRNEQIKSVAYSPDGKYFASGEIDGSINLWAIDELGGTKYTASFIRTIWNSGEVETLAFSNDGNILASGTQNDAIRLWNVPDGNLLDLPLRDKPTQISSVVFSPTGGALAASSYTGEVDLWRNAAIVLSPQYFNIARSNHLTPEVVSDSTMQVYNEAAEFQFNSVQSFDPRTLYQLANSYNIDLFSPTKLPSGWIFNGERRIGQNIVVSRFEDSTSDKIFLLQQNGSGYQPLLIGTSATVERALVNNQLGEFVVGDWQGSPGTLSMGHLYWNASSISQRLRWEDGTLLFEIYYLPDSTRAKPDAMLSKNDLISIAESLAPILPSSQPDFILMHYSIRVGDSCESIAGRFATNVIELQQLNPISNICSDVTPGQSLVVPLPQERVTLSSPDFNCEGYIKELQVIPDPSSQTNDRVLGVEVNVIPQSGNFQTKWKYTIADANAAYFTYPQILRQGNCAQFLALNVVGGPGSDSGLKVFHWSLDRMVLVLAADGFYEGNYLSQGQSTELSTQQILADQADGICKRITTNYVWNGISFMRTSTSTQTGFGCEYTGSVLFPK